MYKKLNSKFGRRYRSSNTICRMQNCFLDETQEHIYSKCVMLNNSLKQNDIDVPYNGIFSKSVKKQIEVVKRFENLLEVRNDIMETQ